MLLRDRQVKTVFDVGANDGQTSLKYRDLFAGAMIYSFEPFAEALDRLRQVFSDDPLIKPVEFAVSNEQGRRQLLCNKSSYTNSLLPPLEKTDLYQSVGAIEVPVTTIDRFCSQQSIDEIQILKMDIQGGELAALEGAAQMLERQDICLIYTELLFAPLYEGQGRFFKICDFLSGYGYELFDMYNFAYQENGRLAWGDAIFISPAIKRNLS